MHVDLAAQLPPEGYLALDSAAGMDPEKRAKFHKACQDSAVTALLDNTTSAAFGHQTLLALTEGPGGPTHRPLQARTRPGRRRALSAAENGNSATHYRF